MTFFIVEEDAKAPYSKVTDTSKYQKNPPEVSSARLISWNEVYPTYQAFKDAIITAAKLDPVCQQIRRQSLDRFGLDPFKEEVRTDSNKIASEETIDQVLNRTFLYFAHPLIGNLNNLDSGGRIVARKTTLSEPLMIPENWNNISSQSLNMASRKAIGEIFKIPELKELKRAGRDQVKIVRNIIELARAFVGEVTTVGTRRLERIFALKICKSEDTKDTLIKILKNAIANEIVDHVRTAINTPRRPVAFPAYRFQYSRYFFPKMNELSLDGLIHFINWAFKNLISTHSEGSYTPLGNEKSILDDIKSNWVMFPENIRIAILLNDIYYSIDREVGFLNRSFKITNFYSKSEQVKGRALDLSDTNLTLDQSPDLQYGLNLDNSSDRKLSFFKAWNRNEYHDSTQTYRYFMMPLFSGPSGHITNNIENWMQFNNATLEYDVDNLEFDEDIDKDEFPADGGAAIASVMFAFWRLYYDKRLSPYHTLAETFEGTNHNALISLTEDIDATDDLVIEAKDASDPSFVESPVSKELDAKRYLLNSIRIGGDFKGEKAWMINPIRLMNSLYKVFYTDNGSTLADHETNLKGLSTEIDSLRTSLTNDGFFIPQYTKTFSSDTGFDVKKYVTVSNKSAPVLNDSTEVVMGTPVFNSMKRKRTVSTSSSSSDIGTLELNKVVKKPKKI